jgi:hypothetical protein
MTTALETRETSTATDVGEIKHRLVALLPWRDVEGVPLRMGVAEVGPVSIDAGTRPNVYAVVFADSFDSAAELRAALAPVAGLSEEEWRTGWFETPERLFAIRIYPTL